MFLPDKVPDVNLVWPLFDLNNDGTIDFDEFISFVKVRCLSRGQEVAR